LPAPKVPARSSQAYRRTHTPLDWTGRPLGELSPLTVSPPLSPFSALLASRTTHLTRPVITTPPLPASRPADSVQSESPELGAEAATHSRLQDGIRAHRSEQSRGRHRGEARMATRRHALAPNLPVGNQCVCTGCTRVSSSPDKLCVVVDNDNTGTECSGDQAANRFRQKALQSLQPPGTCSGACGGWHSSARCIEEIFTPPAQQLEESFRLPHRVRCCGILSAEKTCKCPIVLNTPRQINRPWWYSPELRPAPVFP